MNSTIKNETKDWVSHSSKCQYKTGEFVAYTAHKVTPWKVVTIFDDDSGAVMGIGDKEITKHTARCGSCGVVSYEPLEEK